MAKKKTWSESINEALPLKPPKKDLKSFQDLPPLTALEQPLPPLPAVDEAPKRTELVQRSAMLDDALKLKFPPSIPNTDPQGLNEQWRAANEAPLPKPDVEGEAAAKGAQRLDPFGQALNRIEEALNVGVNKIAAGPAAAAQQAQNKQQDAGEPQFTSKRDLQVAIRYQKLIQQGMTPNEAMERISNTTFAGEANAPATKQQIREAVALGVIDKDRGDRIEADNKAAGQRGRQGGGAERADGSMGGRTPDGQWEELTKFRNSDTPETVARPIPGGVGRLTSGGMYEEQIGNGRFVQQSLPGDIALAQHFGEGWLSASPSQRQAMLRSETPGVFQTPDSVAITSAMADTARFGVAQDKRGTYVPDMYGNVVDPDPAAKAPAGARTVSSIYGSGFATLPSIPPASAQAPHPELPSLPGLTNFPELPDDLKKDKDVQEMLRKIQA